MEPNHMYMEPNHICIIMTSWHCKKNIMQNIKEHLKVV